MNCNDKKNEWVEFNNRRKSNHLDGSDEYENRINKALKLKNKMTLYDSCKIYCDSLIKEIYFNQKNVCDGDENIIELCNKCEYNKQKIKSQN